MMTISNVEARVKELCAQADVRLVCPVKANNRLTRSLGRVVFTRANHTPVKIEFSSQLLSRASEADIEQIIIHEVAHYVVLMRTGVNHGHDAMFKDTVRELGGLNRTGKMSYSLDASYEPEVPAYKYSVICPTCNKVVGQYKVMRGYITHLDDCHCTSCGGKGLYYITNK